LAGDGEEDEEVGGSCSKRSCFFIARVPSQNVIIISEYNYYWSFTTNERPKFMDKMDIFSFSNRTCYVVNTCVLNSASGIQIRCLAPNLPPLPKLRAIIILQGCSLVQQSVRYPRRQTFSAALFSFPHSAKQHTSTVCGIPKMQCARYYWQTCLCCIIIDMEQSVTPALFSL
jgi:hypothetical protein